MILYTGVVKAALKKLAKSLSAVKGVEFAYAYGSFARRADARDIDIAVYLDGKEDPWKRAEEIGDTLEKAVGRRYPLDVHALNGASAAFAFQVMSTGSVLWERERDRRLDWEAHALSRYQDIKPLLDSHDRRYLAA